MTYVEEALKDKLGADTPFGDEHQKAVHMLAREVFDGTRRVIQGGAEVMNWLQEVVGIVSKQGVHMVWHSSTGFPVLQGYYANTSKEIRTKLDGVLRSYSVAEYQDKVDTSRSKNGISPNFVHSEDAAALVKTINRCVARGIHSFHFVHDDYGTHAADTPVLAKQLREAFVEVYREDVLERIWKEAQALVSVEIPRPPRKGTFDIEKVLQSKYFFA